MDLVNKLILLKAQIKNKLMFQFDENSLVPEPFLKKIEEKYEDDAAKFETAMNDFEQCSSQSSKVTIPVTLNLKKLNFKLLKTSASQLRKFLSAELKETKFWSTNCSLKIKEPPR